MGDKVILTVEERTVLGKKVRKLRKEGMVPAVVYGPNFDARAVMAPANVMEKAWLEAGKHHPVQLTIGDKKRLAMIKSADLDPVKRRLRHISFHVVKQNEKVETEVPLHVANAGETEAEKAGLVVLKALDVAQVAALPNSLPDFVEVKSETLVAPGDHVTVADIIPVEGVEVLNDPELVVATVYEPSALQAKNEAAAGKATEDTEVTAENGTEQPAEENGEEASKVANK